MEIKAYSIGSIIKSMGLHFIVMHVNASCQGCYFNRTKKCHCPVEDLGTCFAKLRHDGKDVIFRNLDKNRVPKKYFTNKKLNKKK